MSKTLNERSVVGECPPILCSNGPAYGKLFSKGLNETCGDTYVLLWLLFFCKTEAPLNTCKRIPHVQLPWF